MEHEIDEREKREGREAKKRLDKVTRMLCELTERVPDALISADPELRAWVDEHRRADEERERSERAKKQATKKSIKAQLAKLQAELEELEED